MLWFILTVVFAIYLLVLHNTDKKESPGIKYPWGLVAGWVLGAAIVNVFVALWWNGWDDKHMPLTSPVKLETVNDEAKYTFTAGGKKCALDPDNVKTIISDKNEYVREDQSRASILWTVLPTDWNGYQHHTLYVKAAP